MTAHLIDCGHSVIRIEIESDHAHLTVISPSIHDEAMHQPAESAMAFLNEAQVKELMVALSAFRPTTGERH